MFLLLTPGRLPALLSGRPAGVSGVGRPCTMSCTLNARDELEDNPADVLNVSLLCICREHKYIIGYGTGR